MTSRSYAQKTDDGIDVSHLAGSKLSAGDKAAFDRYQKAFDLAVYWPAVEHFRACVAAYDEMVKGNGDER